MILFGVAAGTALAESNWRELIKWQKHDAIQQGNIDPERKIFIYFFSKRCGYCRKLEKESFTNRTIVDYINENYTPILVDGDKERQLIMRAGVTGFPNLLFLTHKSEPIARYPGYLPQKAMLNMLQYIHTDSYKSMALNDFIKKNGGN